jgi:hypothetical protein
MRVLPIAFAVLATLTAAPLVLRGAPAHAQATTARVRIVHMSPDAPALDVTVDGQATVAGLAFRSASGYTSLAPGARKLRVTAAGQGQRALIEADLPLQAGQDLTLVALGRLADISALPLQDDNGAPPAGKAKVRFMHASPDAPPVDISVKGGPVIFPNVGFKSVAGYVAVDAGTYALEVRPAGGTNVALNLPSVTFLSGQVVTIFGAGLLANGTLAAVPVDYGGAAAGLPAGGTGVASPAAAPAPDLLALVAIALLGAGMAARARLRRARPGAH